MKFKKVLTNLDKGVALIIMGVIRLLLLAPFYYIALYWGLYNYETHCNCWKLDPWGSTTVGILKTDQLHIVRYENLKSNLGLEMEKLMNFFNLEFDKSLESCVVEKQTGSFKRPSSDVDYKKFLTKSQSEDVEKTRNIVYKKLGFIS